MVVALDTRQLAHHSSPAIKRVMHDEADALGDERADGGIGEADIGLQDAVGGERAGVTRVQGPVSVLT